MKITVIKQVTARAGATTGADKITTLTPGFDAEIEYLSGDGITSDGQELPNGDIWAKLLKEIRDSAGHMRVAYVAVRVSGVRYCNTLGGPAPVNSNEWNAALEAVRTAINVTLNQLRK